MSVELGYAGKILMVDLSSARMTDVPTADYADKFIGGLGIATKICWDELPVQVGALDPGNRLIFITGPLGGVPRMGGSRWWICGKTPGAKNEQLANTCGGGNWGAYLKFSGYDGIVIQGKSEKPVYLLVHDGVAELRDGSSLWGKTTRQASKILKDELGSRVGVVTIGPAGENIVPMATVVADDEAVGASGFGAVMGSKKLKAIAVRGSSKVIVADQEKLDSLVEYVRQSLRGRLKNCHYKGYPWASDKLSRQLCYGCMRDFNCSRVRYKAADGETGKFICQSADFYTSYAMLYYGDYYDTQFKATKLADDYGLDTHTRGIEPIIGWLSSCYSKGLLTDESTGLPLSKIGSLEFIETFVKKISYRDGFGDILAGGLEQILESVGGEAGKVDPFSEHFYWPEHQSLFDPRLLITTGIITATSAKRRIAEVAEVGHLVDFYWERWVAGVEGIYMSPDLLRAIAKIYWGSEIAADFSTYEGKALAAKMIQDRYHAFDSLGLCSWAWPIAECGGTVSGDHIGDTTLESQIYSAVTGNEIDQEELYKIGERVFNLERAVLVRGGRKGREDDQLNETFFTVPLKAGQRLGECKCWVPGKNGELLIKNNAVVDREKFETTMDEYYQLRGWDIRTGFQTKARLEELGLEDIVGELEQSGLVM